MYIWCKFLALITLLHIFLLLFLHIWPPIGLSNGSMRQRSASYMVSTISSCNSLRSSSDASGSMQSRYGPKKERLYNFWSSDIQKWSTFLRTLPTSNLSSGKMSSFKNNTMGSIQVGPILIWWTWTISHFTSMGLYKSSIRIIRGKLCTKEVTSMARESACVFPLLGTCSRLNDSNLDCKCLTWLNYPCILSSLASSSPFTWLTTSLKSENIFTTSPSPPLPPKFFGPWTFLPVKPHTQPRYLWSRNPVLTISHWWFFQGIPGLTLL